jgi:hypothetical protein
MGSPATACSPGFGNKAELTARLLGYCREQPDCRDVEQVLLAQEKPPAQRMQNDPAAKGDSNEIGFVYLLKSGRHFKVGRTNSAGRRERELSIQLPERAEQVHVIETDNPVGIERYWHQRFAARRKNGEWFELAPADVKALKRRKFM